MSESLSLAGAAAAITLSSDQAYGDDTFNDVDVLQVQKRYNEERAKRLRDDGNQQFVDISLSEKFRQFQDDPWADTTTVKDAKTMFPDNHCEMLILGGGWSGLLYAVRMIQAGIRPEDIRIVDIAGGFGGTWYYNRYPGIMCDVESYSYLPLLEETGYMPKHRYSYGDEIRNYANLVAEKWKLTNSAVFQTKAESLVWDEAIKEWQVELVQTRKGESPQKLKIRSQFVTMVAGVLNWTKLPDLPGILDYKGDIFHSSRWNYSVTGGSQEDPSLINLKDKRVAIVGTGASAIQIIPHLAKWSKHLYVVQRTPSAIDQRDQKETDPAWFQEVTTSSGWQRERLKNFNQHLTLGDLPKVDITKDQCARAAGLVAMTGNASGPKSIDELPAYVEKLHAVDLPRQNRIRARVKDVVNDPEIAKKLQAWYPTWCKRPCFHDDYLPVFNRDNVTLVDTDGKGLDGFTTDALVVGKQSYPVDVIILATGFRGPFIGTPAEKGNLTITGRHGVSMTEEWARQGPTTLHGVLDHNFPNLFLSGPWQSAISLNWLCNADESAKHSAYILAEAKRRADGKAFAVTATAAAVEDWASQVVKRSAPMAAGSGCTPNYFNLEGAIDKTPPEEQMKLVRSGVWGHGIEDFKELLEAWRAEGSMHGIEVRTGS